MKAYHSSKYASIMFSAASLAMYHARHPNQHGDENLRFRLRLLRFAVMFTNRWASSEAMPSASALKALRQKRRNQAGSFRSGGRGAPRSTLGLPDLTEYMTPPEMLETKRDDPYCNADAALDRFTHSQLRTATPQISLLDTLPAFMALSAAQIALQQGTVTDVWMDLAAGYMVQAVAEQYLVYESQRPEILQEAFAWGFDADCNAEENSDEWQINAMFFGEDEVVNGWDSVRDEHMRAVSLLSVPIAYTSVAYITDAPTPVDSAGGCRPAEAP